MFTRNAASRDSEDSSVCALFRLLYRQKNTANETSIVAPMNARKIQPSVDWPNEWTEGTGPPRLMNIPNCANPNAMINSARFHMRNMPRRF